MPRRVDLCLNFAAVVFTAVFVFVYVTSRRVEADIQEAVRHHYHTHDQYAKYIERFCRENLPVGEELGLAEGCDEREHYIEVVPEATATKAVLDRWGTLGWLVHGELYYVSFVLPVFLIGLTSIFQRMCMRTARGMRVMLIPQVVDDRAKKKLY